MASPSGIVAVRATWPTARPRALELKTKIQIVGTITSRVTAPIKFVGTLNYSALGVETRQKLRFEVVST
jgi:hypothetical protein